jgi:hypothetical protein
MSETNPTPADHDSNGDGRDPCGRFGPGNQFGSGGNPFAAKVAALRMALLAAVTEDDVREIAEVLVAQAKDGDKAATKLLFAYTLGKPQPFVSPDRLTVDALRALDESAVPPEVVASIMRRLPAEFALGLSQLGLESAAASHGALLGDMLKQDGEADAADADAERARHQETAKERKRRRKELRRKMEGKPSTNGHDGANGHAKPRPSPSTNGGDGAGALDAFLRLLRERDLGSNGTDQP